MKTPTKMDLVKLHREQYAAPRKPVFVELPPATYLAIEGQGAPGGPEFSQRIGALYAIAFTVKMTRKFAGLQDYVVSKLEAQWWSESDVDNLGELPKEQWHWRLLVRTPEFVQPTELAQAVTVLQQKGKTEPVTDVRIELLHEGQCVQMLHVGPYDQACRTVTVMQAHAAQHGLRLHGRHHEIYLSDPRRVPPEKLRTIFRHPVIAAT